MTILKGQKYALFVGSFVGAVALVLYPIVISPMMDPESYKKIQIVNRAGINQEDIQPGNMKIWTDPFGPSPKK